MEGFLTRDENVSSSGAARPRRCPEGQLLPRARPMSLSQLTNSQLGWGFQTLWDGIDRENLRFRPRVIGIEDR